MVKRLLSKLEEQAIRNCHHDHCGLTTKEAAVVMGIGQRRVQQLLRNAKRKAPQLFPILTKRQTYIRSLINDYGCTFEEVARILFISIRTVDSTVNTLRKKGVLFGKRKQTVAYQDFMDSEIKEKY